MADPAQSSLWGYMPDNPLEIYPDSRSALTDMSSSTDPIPFAILDTRCQGEDKSQALPTADQDVGYISLVNMSQSTEDVEIGHIILSPIMQKTTSGTEVIHLPL
ncbi:hypothetical protein BBP40_001165 [Aspergillus hancockii]|nr:hypothetical protein BBP40_001165 [Aspergillus hancockii]